MHSGEDDLFNAADRGNESQVEQLIRDGANIDRTVSLPDKRDWTALHVVARNGHAHVAKLLIEKGAQLNVQDREGATALYRGAQFGSTKVVELLLKANADVNLRNRYGRSPIFLACMNNREEICDMLLAAGADIKTVETDTKKSPLHVAVEFKHFNIVEKLLMAQADIDAQCNDETTPLSLAASLGDCRLVDLLLRKGANAALKIRGSWTAFSLACFYGRTDVAHLLLRHCCETKVDLRGCLPHENESAYKECVRLMDSWTQQKFEASISERLHHALIRSGFEAKRSALQAAAATFLEDFGRLRRRDDNIFLVGSYAEGWGNSLVSHNGTVDRNSDIDMMQLSPDEPLHIDACSCKNRSLDRVLTCKDGHVKFPGLGSSPAIAHNGSALRPALDVVMAFRCCSYPHLPVIHDQQQRRTQINPAVMEALTAVMQSPNSPCHLVCANPPNQSGHLRVSTTFLERQLMRSLTTVQGHLFIIIKYLVKHEICSKSKGLKTYHAKTLFFRMLDETKESNWQASNLLNLAKIALEKLLNCLHPGNCMTHFFLADAVIYLKSDRDKRQKIAEVVRSTIANLPALFKKFTASLQPAGDIFQFHPFLITPDIHFFRPAPQSDQLQYFEIYDEVREILLMLSSHATDVETLRSRIRNLPDCARTTREILAAMASLKSVGMDSTEAKQILCGIGQGISVSRGLYCPIESAASTVSVQHHMETNDSAWRFLFLMWDRPALSFLPKFIRESFPSQTAYHTYHYINFDALLKCLCLELIPEDVESRSWFEEMLQRDDCDKQDLLMCLHYCWDPELLMRLLRRHKNIVCAEQDIRKLAADLMLNESSALSEDLRRLCSAATLEDLRLRLAVTDAS